MVNTVKEKQNSPLIAPYQLKGSEDYMNAEQQAHFKKILSAWKEKLMQDVDQTVGHLKQEGTAYADPVDSASREEEFTIELRTRDRERKLIRKIELAINAIEQNNYGDCEVCGANIGLRRLEARPTATQCIDCKTFSEIQEKQTVGG